MTSISRRAFQSAVPASSWEEIFEAGPYYHRVSELLEDAQHYAIFVGWQIDSRLPLPFRDAQGKTGAIESLKEKILRLVESKPGFHFYFLMWDHAYFYVLERESWQGRIWDDPHPRVHFLFDNRHPFGGSHHEKLCIIDGQTAFCGGIDLCDERWDSPAHLYSDPRRSLRRTGEHHGPYHDVAVQVTGPICAEFQKHVHHRWRQLSSVPFPRAPVFPTAAPEADDDHLVYLSRTVAEIEGGARRSIVREIEFLYRDLIRAARRRIILEGQYYWSDEINDMLVEKVKEMHGQDFEISVTLTDPQRLKGLTRQLTTHEMKLLSRLEAAAKNSRVRFSVGFPHVHPQNGNAVEKRRSKPVYIHSKVMIVDDRFISIGSANLASRALRVDTEVTLTYEARTRAERAHVEKFAHETLEHWTQPHVHMHPLIASEELARHESELSWFGRFLERYVPWKLFFDPKVPWFHEVERRFRRLDKSPFPWMLVATAVLWAASSLGAMSLASFFIPTRLVPWDWIYAFALTSVWFSPIPFTAVAVFSVFQLGFQTGSALSICSLWIAALQGYWLTRGFPTYLTRFYRASGPSWLPKRLGLREFPATVSVSIDPRIDLRSKIAYQGLYCVPIPWFAMNFLLVLPSALYVFLKIVIEKTPSRSTLWLTTHSSEVLFMLAFYTSVRLVGSAVRKRKKRASR